MAKNTEFTTSAPQDNTDESTKILCRIAEDLLRKNRIENIKRFLDYLDEKSEDDATFSVKEYFLGAKTLPSDGELDIIANTFLSDLENRTYPSCSVESYFLSSAESYLKSSEERCNYGKLIKAIWNFLAEEERNASLYDVDFYLRNNEPFLNCKEKGLVKIAVNSLYEERADWVNKIRNSESNIFLIAKYLLNNSTDEIVDKFLAALSEHQKNKLISCFIEENPNMMEDLSTVVSNLHPEIVFGLKLKPSPEIREALTKALAGDNNSQLGGDGSYITDDIS